LFLTSMKMSTPQSKTTRLPHDTKSRDFEKLQRLINVEFKDTSLLKNAFIHRSYLNEHKNFKGASNERLEFLGDAILSGIVSRFLYRILPKSPEGELTQFRASLVRTETLAKLSQSLELGKYLYLAKGEEESGGRENKSILANTFEALVGAIFLDAGSRIIEPFIQKIILDKWQILSKTAVVDNKSKLQEAVQRKFKVSPVYKLLSSWGPDHSRQFEIGVYQNQQLLGTGTGRNKQIAAQQAAKNALEKL